MQERAAAWARWRRRTAAGKLAQAATGFRRFIAAMGRRGAWGLVAAVILAPVGAVYVVASVVRDTIVYRAGKGLPRSSANRRAYQRHRFGGTQRLVHWREHALVTALCRRAGTPARVLDVPSGYGRFASALSPTTPFLVCADINARRLAALKAAVFDTPVVRADLQAALPFRTSTFELVVHLRYLQHADAGTRQEHAVAEVARVSARYVVLSYYRRGNLHALVHALQEATRVHRGQRPTMIDRRELVRLAAGAGCRILVERSVLPGFHAQRVVLLEKLDASLLVPRPGRAAVRAGADSVVPPRRRPADTASA